MAINIFIIVILVLGADSTESKARIVSLSEVKPGLIDNKDFFLELMVELTGNTSFLEGFL